MPPSRAAPLRVPRRQSPGPGYGTKQERAEAPPTGFHYGTEYTQAQINSELGSAPPKVVKEVDNDGHGTHVAGIAAGDGSSSASGYIGVAPGADIIFVKTTFTDADIIDGITYIKNKAVAAGEPFVINLSLGSQEGAHDGTSADEIAIDAVLRILGVPLSLLPGTRGRIRFTRIVLSHKAVPLFISFLFRHIHRRASRRTIMFTLTCGMEGKIS